MEQRTLTQELLKKIDDAAIMWNKTKDSKYKDLWYKLIKDNYGTNNSKRRIVSINSVVKADDGTCVFIGTSKLHGPMRDTKVKVNRVRRHIKPTHHE
jgi:hypothetical protein